MPLDEKGRNLIASAQQRALRRLARKYKDEFDELYEEELKIGPAKGRYAGESFRRKRTRSSRS